MNELAEKKQVQNQEENQKQDQENWQTKRFEGWAKDYTFDNCKLNLKEYGDFLMQYLIGEQGGFVLNLDGAWGAGKTEFLRRMYSGLKEKNHPVIYIDAWESDFSENPLQVVASELLKQLENFYKQDDTKENTIGLHPIYRLFEKN